MVQYNSWLYWLALILPNLIIGTVSAISIIVGYRSSKINNLKNMIFAQREKVIDSFIEKSAELIAITDPLILNSKINEYTPLTIPHSQFMEIMQNLLSIDNKVQTLSSVIKLYTYSVYSENNLQEISKMYECIDCVQEKVQKLVLNLVKLHSSNTQEGAFLRSGISELKSNLERTFSEDFREPYIQMVVSITSVAQILRLEAMNFSPKFFKSNKKNANNRETDMLMKLYNKEQNDRKI